MQDLPHNLQAEQAVLAAMLIDQEAVVKAMNLLIAEDFYRETHKLIFSAMSELFQKGEAVNLISLQALLSDKKQLEQVGLGYILGLHNALPTGAQVEQFANIVKAEAIRRRLCFFGKATAVRALQGENIQQELEGTYQELVNLLDDKRCLAFQTASTLVQEYLDDVGNKDPESTSYTGLETNYQSLDEITNGLQDSDFIILAARPSMGKTAMALSLVGNMIFTPGEEPYRIAFFSMEMSNQQLMNRLMAYLTGIDSMRLYNNRLDKGERQILGKTGKLISQKELYIDDTGGLTVGELQSRARRLHLEKPLNIVFVDYLQLMSGSANSQDRQQAIAEISRSLKALARELNIPVVAISQLSRAVEGRQVKRPMMSDLRESGSLEQDADLVLFLYRDDYYFSDSDTPGITELIIAKHRNGPVGTLKFYFEKQTNRFVELI